MRAEADADDFLGRAGRTLSAAQAKAVHETMLRACRWQCIVSSAQEPRFGEALTTPVTPARMERLGAALAPIVAHVRGAG